MTDTQLTIAEREAEAGRQRSARQEELVRDLVRHRCSPELLLFAERLLKRSRRQQALREQHAAELRDRLFTRAVDERRWGEVGGQPPGSLGPPGRPADSGTGICPAQAINLGP